MHIEKDFAAYFLGAYAENNDVFEEVLLEFYRDHVYWRRSFHPEDQPPIDVTTKYENTFQNKIGHTKQVLHRLTAKLKQSVPFYHPRYIGHMSSDLLMSGLLAQIITSLYNPNNVCDESAPVTVKLELEYGKKLAGMFGFFTSNNAARQAFGHLTSGGTVANYQGLWYGQAIKYFPLALSDGIRGETEIQLIVDGQKLTDMSPWQLFNLTFEQTLDLKQSYERHLAELLPEQSNVISERVQAGRIEQLGNVAFHQRYPSLGQPVVLVPATAHYSWQKAVKLLGIGTGQLVKVPTDDKMRICPKELASILEDCLTRKQPVMSVVGVLGTTEFGTIDPIDKLVSLRRQYRREGLDFLIHVDAAWGGFLMTMFKDEQGALLSNSDVAKSCDYFPSNEVYRAFSALSQVETITVDPHKLGYLPFGCGAFVCKQKEARELVSQSAAYVFDTDDNSQTELQLGQYILEGSKPGAIAAGAYVAEQVLPFHANGLGKLPEHSISVTEYFYDSVKMLDKKMAPYLRINVPIEPDSNLICLAFNQAGNNSAAITNSLVRSVYDKLHIDTTTPLQSRAFFASCTKIYRRDLSDVAAARICQNLDLDADTFVAAPNNAHQADHLFVLRHTLMNPWLVTSSNNYIDEYLTYLEQQLTTIVEAK